MIKYLGQMKLYVRKYIILLLVTVTLTESSPVRFKNGIMHIIKRSACHPCHGPPLRCPPPQRCCCPVTTPTTTDITTTQRPHVVTHTSVTDSNHTIIVKNNISIQNRVHIPISIKYTNNVYHKSVMESSTDPLVSSTVTAPPVTTPPVSVKPEITIIDVPICQMGYWNYRTNGCSMGVPRCRIGYAWNYGLNSCTNRNSFYPYSYGNIW